MVDALSVKKPPSWFWLFRLKNGKKRLGYGPTVEDARRIMGYRMSAIEMAQIVAGDAPQRISQRELRQHVGELG